MSKSKNKRKNGKRKGSVWNNIKQNQRNNSAEALSPKSFKEIFGY